MSALILGHSHIRPLLSAAHRSKRTAYKFALMRKHGLGGEASDNQPVGQLISADSDDPGRSSSLTSRSIASNFKAVVSCIGGNAHNVLGLVDHPRPFDFVLSEFPLLPGRELIPQGLIRSTLEARVADQVAALGFLVQRIGLPTYHLISPPPIPSSKHISDFSGKFAERLHKLPVAPKLLRYKLWRLHSQIFAASCSRLGIRVIEVPPAAVDEEGYLAEAYWGRDPTHGNDDYGALVLEQIDRCLSNRTPA